MKISPVFILLLLNCISCQKSSDQDQTIVSPNIIFIFSDDHAQKAISAYGDALIQTPNLDRLSVEGMLFKNSFVTNSICGPSRAVVLTGKFSHLNGMKANENSVFDGSQQTMPKLLRENGYQTAVIGKWHLGSKPTGFDHWEVLLNQGTYYDPEFKTISGVQSTKGYVTNIITDKALDWLKNERDESKPFMLMYQHKAPHRSWWPESKYFDLYADTTFTEPSTLFDDYQTRGTAAKNATMRIDDHMSLNKDLKLFPDQETLDKARKILKRDDFNDLPIKTKQFAWQTTGILRNYGQLTLDDQQKFDQTYGKENEAYLKANLSGQKALSWKYQRYIKDYLRTIKSVDDNLGRLLNYLDESGLDENTIIIYSSDQGFYLGEHGWFDKRFMYEQSLRTPLIIKCPGVTSGTTSNLMVQNIDYAQTILEMAGIQPPKDMQGLSLVPVLEGNHPTDWRNSIYYHYYEYPGWHDVPRHYGVRTERYKLIHFYELDEWELYDLQSDPNELNNLIGKFGMEEITMNLEKRLEKLQNQYGIEKNNEDHF